jgi:hypothetical protein
VPDAPFKPITLTDDERPKLTDWTRRPKTAQRLAPSSSLFSNDGGAHHLLLSKTHQKGGKAGAGTVIRVELGLW